MKRIGQYEFIKHYFGDRNCIFPINSSTYRYFRIVAIGWLLKLFFTCVTSTKSAIPSDIIWDDVETNFVIARLLKIESNLDKYQHCVVCFLYPFWGLIIWFFYLEQKAQSVLVSDSICLHCTANDFFWSNLFLCFGFAHPISNWWWTYWKVLW